MKTTTIPILIYGLCIIFSHTFLFAQPVQKNVKSTEGDNPNLPTEISFMPNIPLPEGLGPEGASGDGRYLFVPLSNRDVHVYDMQNINSPILVSKIEGVVPVGKNLGSTFYFNNLLFVSDWDKNLHLYNCSDPSNIVKISTSVIGGNIASMSFEGNYAHLLLRYVTDLASNKSKFVVLDISNPLNLQIKSEIIVDGTGQNHCYSASRKLVHIRGTLSGVTGALTTIDLNNINVPQILNVTNQYFNNLIGFDNYFIVSQRDGNQSTLSVYNTTNASNPSLIKSINLPLNKNVGGMANVNGTLLIYTSMQLAPYTNTILTYFYDESLNEFLAGPTIDDNQGWGATEFVIFKEPVARQSVLNKLGSVNSIANSFITYYAVFGYSSKPQRVIALKWPGSSPEPTLTVSGTRRKNLKCPTEVVQGNFYNTGAIVITADDDSDWSLGGFKLEASGNGNEKFDVADVLIDGAATVTTLYFEDNGIANVSFTPPIVIAKGVSKVFTVSYRFAFDPEAYAYDTIKVFNWQTKGVTATPLEYPPGLIQGEARMDSLIFARVQVLRGDSEFGYYAKIQDAINSDQTIDGDKLIVCDGVYEEQLFINKELHVKSKNGPKETSIYPFIELPKEEVDVGIFLSGNNITFEGFTIYGSENSNYNGLIGIGATGDNINIRMNYIRSFTNGILAETEDQQTSINKFSKKLLTNFNRKKTVNSGTVLISENSFEDSKSIDVYNYSSAVIEKNLFTTEGKDCYISVENPGNLTIKGNQSISPLIIAIIDTTNNGESDSGAIELSDNEISTDTTGGIGYMGDGKGKRLLIKSNKKFDFEIDKCVNAELINNTVPGYISFYSPNGEIDLVDNKISGKVFIENVNNGSQKKGRLNIRNNFFDSDTSSGLILNNVFAGADTSVKHLIMDNEFEGEYFEKIVLDGINNAVIEKNLFTTEGKDCFISVENPGNLTIKGNQSISPLIIAIIDTTNDGESYSGAIELSDNEISTDTTGGIGYMGDGKGKRLLMKSNKKFDFEIDKCMNAELINNTVPGYISLCSPNGEIDLVDNKISGKVFIENVNNGSQKKGRLKIRNNFFDSDTSFGLILNNVFAGVDTSVKHLIINNNFEGEYFGKIELDGVNNAWLDSNTVHGQIELSNSSNNNIRNNQIHGRDVHSFGVDIGPGSANNLIANNLINGFRVAGIDLSKNKEKTRIEFNLIGTNEEGTVAIPNCYGILLDESAKVTIEDNLISENLTGIMIRNLCEDILIKNNIIGPNLTLTERFKCDAGIFVNNSNKNITIEGNNISGLSMGIKFRHTIYSSFSSKLENIIIKNNLFGISTKLANLACISVWDGFSNNLIENNRMSYNGYAILMEGQGVEKNTIKDNIIGLNEEGTGLGMVVKGIEVKYGPSENIIVNNTVAATHSMLIGGDNTEKNVVRSNTIGIDINKTKSLWNELGVVIGAGAKNNTVEKNVIGGSSSAISISNPGTSNNKIQENIIGTDITFSKKFSITNFGILIVDGATNNIIRNNTIGHSDSSAAIWIQGFNTSRNLVYSNNLGTNTVGNAKLPNPFGVVLLRCSNNTITLNKIWHNTTGIYALNSSNTVFQNDIQHCTGNTGIHLENSNTEIIGNVIANDATDAIKCTDGSKPRIFANNIYSNSGFGLLNSDPKVKINADGNWWGNASGPSGIGFGSGEKIGGNINLTNWLSSESKLIISAATDTLFIKEKGSDSLSIFYSNRENQTDVLTVAISSDKENWIIGDRTFSSDMGDYITRERKISFTPSFDAVEGNIAKVFLSVSSQSNSSLTANDTFYVAVYKSSLHYLRINPDTLKCSVGETAQFNVSGYDRINNNFPVEVIWSANGGTIDSSGLFTAGTKEGIYLITAKDKNSEVTSTAFVQIGDVTVSVEETDGELPKEFVLSQNYPNPFNPVTTINYSLPAANYVSLKIYDILGQEVVALVNKEQIPGNYKVEFNGSRFASGVYIYRITAGKFTAVKKFVLMK